MKQAWQLFRALKHALKRIVLHVFLYFFYEFPSLLRLHPMSFLLNRSKGPQRICLVRDYNEPSPWTRNSKPSFSFLTPLRNNISCSPTFDRGSSFTTIPGFPLTVRPDIVNSMTSPTLTSPFYYPLDLRFIDCTYIFHALWLIYNLS